MMYAAFMKNFLSPIRANWWALESFRPPEPKNVSFPLSRHDVRRVHENFFFHRLQRTDGCYSHFRLLSPKTFDSNFLDTVYLEFMKSFSLADSSELMGVRVISASWYQKRLIPTFWTWCRSSSWKFFFSPIRANWYVLESFRPPEPKNVYSHFLDMMYVEFMKIFFLADSSELICVRVISASWVKNVYSHFLDMMYVDFIKNFFLDDSSELICVRVISVSWAQKRLIPTFQTWCTSSS